jgi:hypothetical protein
MCTIWVLAGDSVFGVPRSNRLMCIPLSFNNRTADTKKALNSSPGAGRTGSPTRWCADTSADGGQ